VKKGLQRFAVTLVRINTGRIHRLTMDSAIKTDDALRKVLADELGHLKHVDDLLAAEHYLERGIRVNVALILRVLEIVLLDVDPKLFYDFATGIGPLPTTAASASLIFIGFINAEFAFAFAMVLSPFGLNRVPVSGPPNPLPRLSLGWHHTISF